MAENEKLKEKWGQKEKEAILNFYILSTMLFQALIYLRNIFFKNENDFVIFILKRELWIEKDRQKNVLVGIIETESLSQVLLSVC